MSEGNHETTVHVSNSVYLMVGALLIVLTAMEISVAYIHALKPVMVPLLLILAAAKFALIAMFFMHLKYEKWALNTMFLFPLLLAGVMLLSLLALFAFQRHYLVFGPPLHIFAVFSS